MKAKQMRRQRPPVHRHSPRPNISHGIAVAWKVAKISKLSKMRDDMELTCPVLEHQRPSMRSAKDVAELVKRLPHEFFRCVAALDALHRSGHLSDREFAIAGSIATTQYGQRMLTSVTRGEPPLFHSPGLH